MNCVPFEYGGRLPKQTVSFFSISQRLIGAPIPDRQCGKVQVGNAKVVALHRDALVQRELGHLLFDMPKRASV